jgi:siroheme synthase-like protein
MFPVSLLLEGRSCLVVGGGRVAARKTAKLLEAGAKLAVVAPAIREQIKVIDGIICMERAFEESDLDAAFIVFALTNDGALNRRVVELCRERGILCSAADSSWVDGDLTMPASFSDDGLTVAVSTGGRACRRSRLLRESLSRHIGFLQDVDLFMMGGDASSLGFQYLEKLKARRAEIEKILPCIQGVHEFMILDTCNRFEIIGLVSGNTDLGLFLTDFPLSIKGAAAFHRFAEIAAGLQSEICGETRIVAQIKEALAVAQQNGWAGSFLQGWTDQTLRISKEIRRATEPHIPALEIEDLVFQTLESKFPNIGKILIVGRGEIGNGLASKLPNTVLISGRDNEELCDQLSGTDVVICATGNPEYVITEYHQHFFKIGVRLIDLSLPRNIDPALPGVVDLSALRASASPENAEMLLSKAREIIDSYAAEYERLINFEIKGS